MAERYQAIPVYKFGDNVTVAMTEPEDEARVASLAPRRFRDRDDNARDSSLFPFHAIIGLALGVMVGLRLVRVSSEPGMLASRRSSSARVPSRTT